MAAEEYNAFFYTLVSTVSPRANIIYLHRRSTLIRHLAFSLVGRGFSYVSVLESSKDTVLCDLKQFSTHWFIV